jgi:DNA-binding response OmpR family regulator
MITYKPFSIREFTARVKALIRRSEIIQTQRRLMKFKFEKIPIDTKEKSNA